MAVNPDGPTGRTEAARAGDGRRRRTSTSGSTPASPRSTGSCGSWCTGSTAWSSGPRCDPTGLVPAEGPVIIAPVHRSFIDFFVASEVTDRKLHYMAKDSLWKHALLARILPSVGAFPVHRESADREAMRRAQQVLDAGEVLILFPEGERRSGPVVEDLHEGVAFLAARTGATVVPVGIGGSASVMPKGTRVPRPRHIHLEVGRAARPAGPHRSGRVPRSRIHLLTEELTAALQVLYDRAVAVTGRY